MTTTTDKMDAKTNDVMTKITETVIEAMKTGTAPWQKPWEDRHGGIQAANRKTGNAYRGLNAQYLMILGAHLHGGCMYWAGYKQAQELGGNVRKGEKATQILAPMMRKGTDKKTGEDFMYPAGFRIVNVWNIAQCDGIEIPTPEATEARVLDAAMLDQFATDTGAIVHTGGDVACYIPSADTVRMPAKDQFLTEGGYYGTLLHELVHWTRHETRLNRTKERGQRAYAYEELIAELGAYYASEKIGCPNECENHASYLESWLKALESDIKYLWQAASAAERAADYLIECAAKGKQERINAAKAA